MKSKKKILIVTNMYPHEGKPYHGIFVKEQVDAIRDLAPYLEIDVMLIKGYINSFNYLKAIFNLRKLVNKKDYALIHAHYGLSGLVSKFQWKIPTVCTFHGSDILYVTWQSLISRIIAPFLTHSIAVSESIEKKLPTKKVSVIPCGVDLDFFKPMDKKEAREKLGLDLNKKYLLFTAHPERRVKNYPLFKKVLDLVKREYDAEEIILSGFDRKGVRYNLNAADVVVITSHSEASNMVIKESLACDTPVVSVDIGDAREILENIDGCYVTSKNPDNLYWAVSKILRREYKTLSFRKEIKYLSNKEIASHIIKLYTEILQKKLKEAIYVPYS